MKRDLQTASDSDVTLPATSKAVESRWTDERVTLEKLKSDDETAWNLVLIQLTRIAKEYVRWAFSEGARVLSIEDADEMLTLTGLRLLYERNAT